MTNAKKPTAAMVEVTLPMVAAGEKVFAERCAESYRGSRPSVALCEAAAIAIYGAMERERLASLEPAAPVEDFDKQAMRDLRPSRETLERIERHEQANAAGYHAVRNMPIGSDAAPVEDGEVVERLWLWKNFVDGRPEYWAFDNPYPTFDGGDPQTLGGPCGWALFKKSTNGRPEVSAGEVERAIETTSQPPAADALVEALRPFAEFCEAHDYVPDEHKITLGSALAKQQLTMGDCRRARAALAKRQGGGE